VSAPLPVFSSPDADMREAEAAQALAGLADMRCRGVILADALRSCLTRLDDIGQGDGPTAQAAQRALAKAGL